MIFHKLNFYVRQTITQAGWPLPLRLRLQEWTGEGEGKGLTVRPVAADKARELLLPTLSFSRIDCESDEKSIQENPEGNAVLNTRGWAPGVHRVFASAKIGNEMLAAEVPVLILEKDAYWRHFAENLESKYKNKPRSQSLLILHDRMHDVRNGWVARWLSDLGVKVEWKLGQGMQDAKHEVLKEPVNMWTAYQVGGVPKAVEIVVAFG